MTHQELQLPTVSVTDVLAPLDRKNAKDIYNASKMGARWGLIARHLPGQNGETLRSTLEGKHLAQDYLVISRTVGFLYEAIQHEITDIELLRDSLYQRRNEFFPQAMLPMEHITGDQVSKSHEGRNPLLHTCDDLAQYAAEVARTPKSSRQSDSLIFVEISALILHDFGKLFNTKDPSHGSGSVRWSEQWIDGLAKTFPVKTEQKEIIQYQLNFLMKFHDLPGNVDIGNLTVEDAVRAMLDMGYVPSSELMLSLERVQEADMAGTPGMPTEFRERNKKILVHIRQTLENIKKQYGIADAIVPTEQLISDDTDLVKQFFSLVTRAETVTV